MKIMLTILNQNSDYLPNNGQVQHELHMDSDSTDAVEDVIYSYAKSKEIVLLDLIMYRASAHGECVLNYVGYTYADTNIADFQADAGEEIAEQKAILFQKHSLHQVYVGGIVMNESGQFLLVRYLDKQGQASKWTYPQGRLLPASNNTWESMEKSIAKHIYDSTSIEIQDGSIPFTDESVVGAQGYDKLIQFYICRHKYGEAMIVNPKKVAEVSWKDATELDPGEISAVDMIILDKARKFIDSLS